MEDRDEARRLLVAAERDLSAGCPGLALLLCVPGFALPVVDETSVRS